MIADLELHLSLFTSNKRPRFPPIRMDPRPTPLIDSPYLRSLIVRARTNRSTSHILIDEPRQAA